MTRTTRELATTYFEAWQRRDETTLTGLFTEDVTFRGPMGECDGRDETVAGLLGMGRILDRIEILAMVVDQDDVITWFALHTTTGAPPSTTANWTHVTGGAIDRIRVTFDPRGLLAAG